ncbi:MAG: 16S rRNA (guanine(966)-N(2))-methyltransferase RsmD [Firmicutes bacterium]|nr:16S rRNA (guanine(966)-N(2))-methyltransferase RsmD [Bacillota bacterium]
MLRVIAGSAKGRRLHSVPGTTTRPALARVRAAVFNIAQPFVEDCRFLDLFAGTGAYSVEALSRGASHATLVDLDPRAVAVIKRNLAMCGFTGKSTVIQGDVLRIVNRLRREGSAYDFIMVAPPYFRHLGPKAMEKVASLGLLAEGGLCFVQHDVKEKIPPEFGDLVLIRKYTYGTNALSLYRHRGLCSGGAGTMATDALVTDPVVNRPWVE